MKYLIVSKAVSSGNDKKHDAFVLFKSDIKKKGMQLRYLNWKTVFVYNLMVFGNQ